MGGTARDYTRSRARGAAPPFDAFRGQSGILYEGLSVLGRGAILSCLILASVAVFVIERQLLRSAAFALAGAVLTFFGSNRPASSRARPWP